MAAKKPKAVTCLFLDIGGVLLTNGWDHVARRRAALRFKLDYAETEARHRLIFDALEQDHLTLGEYLDYSVFWRKRPFTRGQFRKFMFEQSKPYAPMLELMRGLKSRHGLKIIVVSNESRELNAHRIRQFKLDGFVDAFVSSCFIGLRKPDPAIFEAALDISQAPPERIAYVENTPMFIEMAREFGIRGILHKNYESTREQLAALGLALEGGVHG